MNDLKSIRFFCLVDAIDIIDIATRNKIDFSIRQEEILNAQHFNGTRLLIENIAGEQECITHGQYRGKSTSTLADMLDEFFQSKQK